MSDLSLPPDVAELIARSKELARRSLELEKEVTGVSEQIRKRQVLERATPPINADGEMIFRALKNVRRKGPAEFGNRELPGKASV
jgi:hypothetical protein